MASKENKLQKTVSISKSTVKALEAFSGATNGTLSSSIDFLTMKGLENIDNINQINLLINTKLSAIEIQHEAEIEEMRNLLLTSIETNNIVRELVKLLANRNENISLTDIESAITSASNSTFLYRKESIFDDFEID